MRRLASILVLILLTASTAAAVRRYLATPRLTHETVSYIPFGWTGRNPPMLQVFCDTSGDRIYMVASRALTQEGRELVTVQAMSVVPQGCRDWPRN